MNKPLLFTLFAAVFAGGMASAEAKPKHHGHDRGRYDKSYRHHPGEHSQYRGRTRTIYVIERGRPVRRVVYASPGGGYYRVIDGRRSTVRGRTFTSYPSKYYYPDGRRRLNVSFSF
jgi:hypothetical protein